MAAQENHIDVVRLLLEHGANQRKATEVESLRVEIYFHIYIYACIYVYVLLVHIQLTYN